MISVIIRQICVIRVLSFHFLMLGLIPEMMFCLDPYFIQFRQ